MTLSRYRLALTSMVIAAGLAIGAALVVVRDSAAEPVELREEGAIVSVGGEDDAIEAVSKRVGFDVRPLRDLPEGLRLVFVDSTLGPPDQKTILPLAFLVYGTDASADDGMRIRVEQAGVRFAEPAGHGEKFDAGVPGMDAWFERTPNGIAYTLLTADRGFLVLVAGGEHLSVHALSKMSEALVE